eukprot:TRINITY_DN730_c0_g1_i1.p1 TRINITY_DN730_c0_g1~~TRINITY_DN730_c0_g1_i1.p1  ORF type:complete len:119 (+),score=12.68 TRINITY_DN730_c0_g1_i1:47-358(+)
MGDFEEGLCGCFSDFTSCIITYFCPFIQGAFNKAEVDGRDCTVCDFLCMCYSANVGVEYYTRQQIRAKFGYDYKSFVDCLLICYCTHCVICQHARELKNKAGK